MRKDDGGRGEEEIEGGREGRKETRKNVEEEEC